jgi:hypothetical protein
VQRKVRPGLRGGARNGTATTTVTASRNDFHRPPQPIVVESIGTIRSKGAAVESICLILREQGCQIATRTYRVWRSRRPVARPCQRGCTANLSPIAWLTDLSGQSS